MCVDHSPTVLKRLRQKRGRLKCWKVLKMSTGEPVLYGGRYSPGVNVAPGCRGRATDEMTRKYRCEYEYGIRGLHVWRSEAEAKSDVFMDRGNGMITVAVPVWVSPADIIAADKDQLAATRLRITAKDWAAAKLPKRAVAKRRIVKPKYSD